MRVLVVVAALLALLACLAGVAKHTLPPFLTRKLNEGIYQAVVWRPDSPPDVQGEQGSWGTAADRFGRRSSWRGRGVLVQGRSCSCLPQAGLLLWHLASPQPGLLLVAPALAERFTRDDHPGDPPILLRMYFFNITNLAEVRDNGAKPVLVSPPLG